MNKSGSRTSKSKSSYKKPPTPHAGLGELAEPEITSIISCSLSLQPSKPLTWSIASLWLPGSLSFS
jgi:hypothetical protein